MAQPVRSLPAMQETQVWSLGWEDPLEKEMATHSSILAWKIPWTEEPGGLQSKGLQRVKHDWVTGHQQQQAFNIRHSAQAHQYTNAHTQIHTYSSLTWDFGCKLQNQHESDDLLIYIKYREQKSTLIDQDILKTTCVICRYNISEFKQTKKYKRHWKFKYTGYLIILWTNC